jgi:hypothetical protein
MKRRILLFIAVYGLIGITGCGHLENYLDIAREQGVSKEYLTALDQWTRSAVIYSQFETQAHIAATYRSPGFIRAYLDEYSRIYGLEDKEQKKREEIQKGLNADLVEFIFYASIPEKTSNDFDRRGSIWTVFLVDGKGERIPPWEIRRIDPVTPLVTKFYPYVNPYHGIAYRIRFQTREKPEGDLQKLLITGVLGKAELTFK